jgi:hypothetical protein
VFDTTIIVISFSYAGVCTSAEVLFNCPSTRASLMCSRTSNCSFTSQQIDFICRHLFMFLDSTRLILTYFQWPHRFNVFRRYHTVSLLLALNLYWSLQGPMRKVSRSYKYLFVLNANVLVVLYSLQSSSAGVSCFLTRLIVTNSQ